MIDQRVSWEAAISSSVEAFKLAADTPLQAKNNPEVGLAIVGSMQEAAALMVDATMGNLPTAGVPEIPEPESEETPLLRALVDSRRATQDLRTGDADHMPLSVVSNLAGDMVSVLARTYRYSGATAPRRSVEAMVNSTGRAVPVEPSLTPEEREMVWIMNDYPARRLRSGAWALIFATRGLDVGEPQIEAMRERLEDRSLKLRGLVVLKPGNATSMGATIQRSTNRPEFDYVPNIDHLTGRWAGRNGNGGEAGAEDEVSLPGQLHIRKDGVYVGDTKVSFPNAFKVHLRVGEVKASDFSKDFANILLQADLTEGEIRQSLEQKEKYKGITFASVARMRLMLQNRLRDLGLSAHWHQSLNDEGKTVYGLRKEAVKTEAKSHEAMPTEEWIDPRENRDAREDFTEWGLQIVKAKDGRRLLKFLHHEYTKGSAFTAGAVETVFDASAVFIEDLVASLQKEGYKVDQKSLEQDLQKFQKWMSNIGFSVHWRDGMVKVGEEKKTDELGREVTVPIRRRLVRARSIVDEEFKDVSDLLPQTSEPASEPETDAEDDLEKQAEREALADILIHELEEEQKNREAQEPEPEAEAEDEDEPEQRETKQEALARSVARTAGMLGSDTTVLLNDGTVVDITSRKWRQHAACRDLDPVIFYASSDEEAEPAKDVCAECVVRSACLEHALMTREKEGVWGGMTERERRRVIRQRRNASSGLSKLPRALPKDF